MSEAQVLEQPARITAYEPFRAQLAELAEANSKAVFDYEDADGNKEARSHVHQLRKTKTAVDKARKAEKQASLDHGRLVDSEAKEIIGQIESMIDVHALPLKAIEDKEKVRVAAHEEAYGVLENYALIANQGDSSDVFKAHIQTLKVLEPDEKFEEFTAAAITAYKKSMESLEAGLRQAEKVEAESAELEKLRAEKDEQERIQREEQIARDATEKAEREAMEAKEQAEEQAQANADRLEKEKTEALEREEAAKQESIESEKRAKQAIERAEEDAKSNVLEAERQKLAEADKREANKKHKAAINNAAVDALIAGGISKTAAKAVVTLIAKREIPNVSIGY